MARITDSNIKVICDHINRLFGFKDCELWEKDETGRNNATIGMFYIDGAYGGVALYCMVTNGGGVSDVFNRGHMTKRELYDAMQAYIRGIESERFKG